MLLSNMPVGFPNNVTTNLQAAVLGSLKCAGTTSVVHRLLAQILGTSMLLAALKCTYSN